MKHIKLLFLLAMTIILINSCSSDDNNTEPLVGTWERIVITSPEGIILKVAFTFNENKSGIYQTDLTLDGEIETGIENFTWSTTGKIVTISSSEIEPVIYNYSINGNELTFINDPDENTVFIKQ